MFLNLFRAREAAVVRWHRFSLEAIRFQNIFRDILARNQPWKPVVMGYYRCESAERACGWFAALCNQFRVLLFVRPGHGQFYLSIEPAVIGNNEIRGSCKFRWEQSVRSISSFSFTLILSLSSLLSLLEGLSRHNGRNRHARYLYKRAGVGGEGGRVRGLARETSSTK